jgi:hypothetical protein
MSVTDSDRVMRSKRQSSRDSHREFFLQHSSPPPSSAEVLEAVAEVLFSAETEWDSSLPPAAEHTRLLQGGAASDPKNGSFRPLFRRQALKACPHVDAANINVSSRSKKSRDEEKPPKKETKEQNDIGRKEAPKCHTELLKLPKLQSTTTSELASKSANQSNQQQLPSFWKPLKHSTNFSKGRKCYTRGNTRESKTKDKNHDKNYSIEMRIKQGKEQSAAPEIENAHILLLLLLRRRRKTKQEKFQTEGAEEQLLLPGKTLTTKNDKPMKKMSVTKQPKSAANFSHVV